MWNSGSVVQSTSSRRRRGCARCSRPTSGTAHAGRPRPWPGRWCPRCRGSRACRRGATAAASTAVARRAARRQRRRTTARARASPCTGIVPPTTQIACERACARGPRCASRSRNAASITSSRAPLSARKYSICGPIDAVLIGTATAPSQPQPRKASSNSTRLPHISATRSPRATPAARSAARTRAAAMRRHRVATTPRRRCEQRPLAEAPAWRRSIAGSVRSRGGSGAHGARRLSVVLVGASAEVGRLHARVAGQRRRRAAERDLAGLEHVAVVRAFERGARVLLDQQDRDAVVAQAAHDREDLLHDQRRQAEARLVEHQQARRRHQRAAQREHLALAARQRVGALRCAARRGAGSARRRRRAGAAARRRASRFA